MSKGNTGLQAHLRGTLGAGGRWNNSTGILLPPTDHQTQIVSSRAIEATPNTADPHLNLGTTYAPGAVALSPLDTRARNKLGQLLFEQGRVSEAEEQFRASIRGEPDAPAYDFLGAIDLRRGAKQAAERNFQAALSLDPSDSSAHFGLGYLYKAAGRKADALSQYQAGLAKGPTNAEALAAVRELRQQGTNATP